MEIRIPELSLVVLMGPSSSGKSTLARQHFKETEIVSSDECRALVSDDENDLKATDLAFELLHEIVRKRLKYGRLTVVDATNLRSEDRARLLQLARDCYCLATLVAVDTPEPVLLERHAARRDRNFAPTVIFQQLRSFRSSLRNLRREAFHNQYIVRPHEEEVTVRRTPLYPDRRGDSGPFDVIGDVHGCLDELLELVAKLGYTVGAEGDHYAIAHADGRRLIFLGDLTDRGPKSPEVLRFVMDMVRAGQALCVMGNHDAKLLRWLNRHNVTLQHGLEKTVAQFEPYDRDFRIECREFIDRLVSHYVLDGGRLVVAHAGLREEMHGRASGAVRSFAMYGETTGETDEFGLPIRYNWALEYRGKATVVYGHTPVPTAEWLNNTICIDTGCVFGGYLTALRYPERQLVSVPARETYAVPARPLNYKAELHTAQQLQDDLLDLSILHGKHLIETRYGSKIILREENTIPALEVMSRFALNPKWLIYLPPTMSPSETANEPGYLEHPRAVFEFYRRQEVDVVICEEKHMGSRAVAIVTRSDEVAQQRFGLLKPAPGVVYTRTGRSFFDRAEVEREFLAILRQALSQSGFWEKFQTDWVCLDGELLPWSAKAQGLLTSQYAATGAAADYTLGKVHALLQRAAQDRQLPVEALLDAVDARREANDRFRAAYRRYCRPTHGVEGLVFAPFHLLATEGKVHADETHTWHLEHLEKICAADPAFLLATPYRVVDLRTDAEVEAAVAWWLQLTEAGGEGLVVKPLEFLTRSEQGLIQPALKCRGREYLRIIYGAEYTFSENLTRLRARNLGLKRRLALREFQLGLEALERFVERRPLRDVHECVFGVLALESEETDPTL